MDASTTPFQPTVDGVAGPLVVVTVRVVVAVVVAVTVTAGGTAAGELLAVDELLWVPGVTVDAGAVAVVVTVAGAGAATFSVVVHAAARNANVTTGNTIAVRVAE